MITIIKNIIIACGAVVLAVPYWLAQGACSQAAMGSVPDTCSVMDIENHCQPRYTSHAHAA